MDEDAHRRGRLLSAESFAGWVFADLLLVLFIVGLGSAIAYTPPEPPKPKPVVMKDKKQKIERIVGMETDSVPITVTVDGPVLSRGLPLNQQQRQAICQSTRSGVGPIRSDRAALVLVFGGASDVVSGQNVARAVASQLNCANSQVFRGRVPTRAFWDGTLPLGKVRLEVFLFVQQSVKR